MVALPVNVQDLQLLLLMFCSQISQDTFRGLLESSFCLLVRFGVTEDQQHIRQVVIMFWLRKAVVKPIG